MGGGSSAPRALEGVRVVELGVVVAGPAAGGLLSDWGAEVIKVEPPAGDPQRKILSLVAGSAVEGSPPFDLGLTFIKLAALPAT